MAKKPKLTIVNDAASPTANPAAPPTTLGKTGAKLWLSIQNEYRLDDAGGCSMLEQICIAADRAAEYADAVAADGAMIRTKTGIREHPLIKHELLARAFIVRSLHRLGLDIEPSRDTPGRPPGPFNRTS